MTVCKCKDDLLVPFSETAIPPRTYLSRGDLRRLSGRLYAWIHSFDERQGFFNCPDGTVGDVNHPG